MAGRRFVLDASALIKLVFDEEHSEALRAWHQEALEENRELFAPYLLRYELGNLLARVARTRRDWTPDVRRQLLDAMTLGLVFVDGESTETLSPPLTYYDAAYVSLARATGATLVGYDEAMLAEAKRAGGVEVLRVAQSMSASQP